MTFKQWLQKPAVLLAVLLFLGLVLAASIAAWTRLPPSRENVEVDSWQTKHILAQYQLTFEPEKKEYDVHVGLTGHDLDLSPVHGALDVRASHQRSPEEVTVERPDCTSPCYKGFAQVELHSRPGLGMNGNRVPVTRWVVWTTSPDVAPQGETSWTFKAHVPGVYGHWTMTVQSIVNVYHAGVWGDRYTYHEAAPIVKEFEFDKT